MPCDYITFWEDFTVLCPRKPGGDRALFNTTATELKQVARFLGRKQPKEPQELKPRVTNSRYHLPLSAITAAHGFAFCWQDESLREAKQREKYFTEQKPLLDDFQWPSQSSQRHSGVHTQAHTHPITLPQLGLLPFRQPLDPSWWKMHWMQKECTVALLQNRSWMQWWQQQQQQQEAPNSHLNRMPKGSQRKWHLWCYYKCIQWEAE